MTPERKRAIISGTKTVVSAILAILVSACIFYVAIVLLQAAIGLFLSFVAAAAVLVIALFIFAFIRGKLGE